MTRFLGDGHSSTPECRTVANLFDICVHERVLFSSADALQEVEGHDDGGVDGAGAGV